jgi:hypothetical protein
MRALEASNAFISDELKALAEGTLHERHELII